MSTVSEKNMKFSDPQVLNEHHVVILFLGIVSFGEHYSVAKV